MSLNGGLNEGTRIMTENGYKNIETLKKGTLITTFKNGFKPIYIIGFSLFNNPSGNKKRIKKMYKIEKKFHPELINDLYLIGCQSILVSTLENNQKIKKLTEGHYQSMASINEKCIPIFEKNTYKIWYIIFKNNNKFVNYGIYANGLLVSSNT
jgi:hypothetical protein